MQIQCLGFCGGAGEIVEFMGFYGVSIQVRHLDVHPLNPSGTLSSDWTEQAFDAL